MHFPTYLLGLASLSIAAPTGNYRRGEGGALELDSVSDLTGKLPIGELGRRGTIADPVAGSADDIFCSDLLKLHGQADDEINCIDGHGDLVPFGAIKRRQEEAQQALPEEEGEAPEEPESLEDGNPESNKARRRSEQESKSKNAGNPLGGLTGNLVPGLLRRSGLGNLHGVTGGLTHVTSGLPNTGKLASDTLRRDVGGLDGITGSLGGVTKGLPDTSSLTSGALGRREIAGLDGITGGLGGDSKGLPDIGKLTSGTLGRREIAGLDGLTGGLGDVTKGLPDTGKLTSGTLGRRFLNGGTVDSLAPATDGLGTATQGLGSALSAAKLGSGSLRRDLDASGGVPDVKELRKQIADDDFFHGKGDKASVEDAPEQAADETAKEAHDSLLPGILRRDLASEIKPLAEGLKPALEPIPSIDTTKMAPGVLRRGATTDIEAATDDFTANILESVSDVHRRAERSSADENGNKASALKTNHRAASENTDKKASSKKADNKASLEKAHSKATEKTSGKPKGGLLGLPVPGVLRRAQHQEKASSKKADNQKSVEKSHSKATEKTNGKPKGGLLGLPVPGVL